MLAKTNPLRGIARFYYHQHQPLPPVDNETSRKYGPVLGVEGIIDKDNVIQHHQLPPSWYS